MIAAALAIVVGRPSPVGRLRFVIALSFHPVCCISWRLVKVKVGVIEQGLALEVKRVVLKRALNNVGHKGQVAGAWQSRQTVMSSAKAYPGWLLKEPIGSLNPTILNLTIGPPRLVTKVFCIRHQCTLSPPIHSHHVFCKAPLLFLCILFLVLEYNGYWYT